MEERYKTNRILFLVFIIIGVCIILGSFGLLVTEEGWGAVMAVMSIGIVFTIGMVFGFFLNRRYSKKDIPTASRSNMRLSDLEIERMIEDASVVDLEQFEKERSSEYEFKYVLVAEKPKNAICMISKTMIGKDESALQCPNCQNYYHTKYLLSWLDKNSKCLICQFELKVKKIRDLKISF